MTKELSHSGDCVDIILLSYNTTRLLTKQLSVTTKISPLRSEKVIAPRLFDTNQMALKGHRREKVCETRSYKERQAERKRKTKGQTGVKNSKSARVNKPAGWASSHYQSASIFVFFSTMQHQLYIHRTESSHCVGTQRHVYSLTKLSLTFIWSAKRPLWASGLLMSMWMLMCLSGVRTHFPSLAL